MYVFSYLRVIDPDDVVDVILKHPARLRSYSLDAMRMRMYSWSGAFSCAPPSARFKNHRFCIKFDKEMI